jgi:hypothetical protein
VSDDKVVAVAAIRATATALAADDGPITFLRNAQAELHKAYLGSMGLTVFGISAATAHDTALHTHEDNLKGGIEHLRDAARQLEVTADRWEQSDAPWVVKGWP